MKNDRREGRLGDEMEAAEVRLTEAAARECRTPADYILWKIVGQMAVQEARKMTSEQRAAFAMNVEFAVSQAAEHARANAPGRLQAALNFKGKKS